VNYTRFPKEDHVPNWERRDNKVTKSDRAELPFHISSVALDLVFILFKFLLLYILNKLIRRVLVYNLK